MTAKARLKVRKEVRVRASRRSDHQLDTEVLANHEKRTSFELDYLDELASTVTVAHNDVLNVREAILRVSDDLAHVPHGTKADPDPQYRKKLLETFHIIQSFWFICDNIKSVVAPSLEREVRRLAPNAFKEEYVPLTPSEEAREGLERLKRLRSRK
jgi:hypothetical protein